MLHRTERNFTFIFLIIVILELLSHQIDALNQLHFATKPAIVLSLLLFFITRSKGINRTIRVSTILALLCCLAGDILLMFESASPIFFMLGLIAFLIGHILYLAAFLKHRNRSKSSIGFIAFLLIYAIGLFYFLKDGLGDMLIPVVIYMIVILSMATSAFLRKGNVSKEGYLFVFIGPILFMVSDSILALNKFHEPLLFANVSIMLSYALAQYCIVIGLLKLKN